MALAGHMSRAMMEHYSHVRMAAKRAGKVLWEENIVVNETRRLAANIQGDAMTPVMLELACVTAN